tara:strand:+ start:3454 stop:4197 length:744 start_codon:yes stop_codon:yes gene_type:complete
MVEEKISIIIPTRERTNGLQELLKTLFENTKYKNRLEICFVIDDDDSYTKSFLDNHDFNLILKYTIIPRGKYILGEWWDIGYNKIATGTIIMLCADDFRFRSQNWDELVYNEFEKYEDKILLVYGDDLFISKRLKIATHFFVHRKWIDNSPFFLPPYFTTDYVDTWLSDIAEILQRKVLIPDLIIEHKHFLIGKDTKEETGTALQDAQKRIMEEKTKEINKKLYYSDEKTKERMEHTERLRKVIKYK